MSTFNVNSSEKIPDYYTKEILKMYSLLSVYQKTMPYRSFLMRNAQNTYNEIKENKVAFKDPLDANAKNNLLCVLSAQIISETISILEVLAAISISPNSLPEERAKKLLNYQNTEIHKFYNELSESTSLDYFKSILCYPKIEKMDVDSEDEEFFRVLMEGNAQIIKDFFIISKDMWQYLKDARNKVTHGFSIFIPEKATFDTLPQGRLPEGCDNVLLTLNLNKNKDDISINLTLIGDKPNNAYLTVARNAVVYLNDIMENLKQMILNQGEPVFKGVKYGNYNLPINPKRYPLYNLLNVREKPKPRLNMRE